MNLDRIIAVRNDKTVYRDGERCLKVFNAGYSKSDVLNEALNQARVEEIGLSIPKILEVTTIEGKWAIVSEYIKGKSLSLLIEEHPEKKEEYLELFVELQLEMNSKVCPLLNRQKDKMNMKICRTDLSATVRYDLHIRLEGMPKHNNVCHGDFDPTNIIISDDGKPYILDWSHATQGNSSADAARTYLLFLLRGKEEDAEKYLDLFCEKSGISKMCIKKWLPIVAAVQTVQANAAERKFLHSFITVTED